MRFGLPPSPSAEVARTRATHLVSALAHLPEVVVEVAESYGALGDGLISGEYAAGWAPPIVCARVEMLGGEVVLRALRGGATSYRAALVCRAGAELDWARPEELVAAWVDENSAAGYLLARSWLAGRRIDAVRGFKRALFTGSYVSALQAVADGRADVTSIFVAAEGAPAHTTLDEVDAALRGRLRIVTTVGETQTDGVVLGPNAERAALIPLLHALTVLGDSEEGADALKRMLQCDALRPAPRRPTSTALQQLLVLGDRLSERQPERR
jgi:phosphonate transport system substrate-binding protein